MEERWKIQPIAWRWVFLLVGVKLLVHVLTSNAYGYFRDELYFLDCARHLQWGYVDDTPGIVILCKLALLMGSSLPVIRTLAALAGAGTVLLSTLLAREMGGGRFAQAFVGLCVLSAPFFLAVDSILCVGTLEPLFWMGCVLLLIRITRTGQSRLWLGFGVVAGLGLEVKYTMLLVLACLLAGLILTPLRRELRRPLFWAGLGLAALIFLPTFLWQVNHHFPLLEDMANIRREGKNIVLAPLTFIGQQIAFLDPLLLPVWLVGLGSLLFGRLARLRALGWFYLFLLTAMIILHAKNYYLGAIYPMLFAAGAVVVEEALEGWNWSRGRSWPKAALAGFVAATFFLFVPVELPLLPPAKLLAYQAFLRINPPHSEVNHAGALDQRFGDQFGWPELAVEVARIYHALPLEEQALTGIYAGNYGEAGAINQFGRALGLPPAICAHQAHSFWGPPAVEPVNLICLGCGREGLERRFDSVEEVGVHHHPWGMEEENRPIYLGRRLNTPFRELWPQIKHWN